MPFTPTHIFAVIPIFYVFRMLPLTALAIGAIIPDFPMFFPLSTYKFSHSPLGIMLYCIPVAMIFYFVFEKVGRTFVRDISPKWVRIRLPQYYETMPIIRAKNLILLCIAFAIGSSTHIVWDSFTHEWGIDLYPVLKETMSILGFSLSYYKLIQYGSTIIGLPLLVVFFVIFIYCRPLQSHTEKEHFSTQKTVMIMVSFLLTPFLIAFYHWLSGVENLGILLSYTIKQSISVCITLFFIYSFLHWWKKYRTIHG